MSDGLLLPPVDEDTAPFWEAARDGRLVVQACADCGRWRFPPRPMCPHCRSLACRWDEVSGRGTVWSFVVAHPPLLPAYAELAPYNVVVVALDEDPLIRLVGNVEPLDRTDLEIGMPVEVVFDHVTEEIALPRWRPVA